MGRWRPAAVLLAIILLVGLAGCNSLGTGSPDGGTATALRDETNTIASPTDTTTEAPTETTTTTVADSDQDEVSDSREEELGLDPEDPNTVGDIPDSEAAEYEIPLEANEDQEFLEAYTALEPPEVKQELVNQTYGEDADPEFLELLNILSDTPEDVQAEAVQQLLEAEDTEIEYQNVEALKVLDEDQIRYAVDKGLEDPDWDNDTVLNWNDVREEDSLTEGPDPTSKNSDDDMLNDREEKLAGTDPASTDDTVILQMTELGIQEVTVENKDKVQDHDNDGLINTYEIQIAGTDPEDANTDGDLLTDLEEHYNDQTDPTQTSLVIGLAKEEGANGWLYDRSNQEYFRELFKEWGFDEVVYIDTGVIEDYKLEEDGKASLRARLPDQYDDAGYPMVLVDEHPPERTYPWLASSDTNVALLSANDVSQGAEREVIIEELLGTAVYSEIVGMDVPEEKKNAFIEEYSEDIDE